MMQKIQRFGGAMITPVLLFAFAGLVLGVSILFTNETLMPNFLGEGTFWHSMWSIIEGGGWAVFNQMELLFVVGLPIGLVKVERGRAVLGAVAIYTTFNLFIGGILTHFGSTFGFPDFATMDIGPGTGVREIMGIRTLDTGLVGALAIAGLSVYIHNKFFTKKLPEMLGIFQGTPFVYAIGFLVMLPIAFLTAWIWPVIQGGIDGMQGFLAGTLDGSVSGFFGVWLYTFLERILIPTGLHHFIWQPFILGPAVLDSGIQAEWLSRLPEFSNYTGNLAALFPYGGFALHGQSKVFGAPGIALAIYFTAKKENRKRVLSILLPVTATAVVTGITEPLEFTFLFIAPMLFIVHAFLAATMSATMFSFGVVGNMGGGLLDFFAQVWVPLFRNHWGMILRQIFIGLAFMGVYFIVFKTLILKFNLITPGREDFVGADDIKLYTKDDYKNKKGGSSSSNNDQLVLAAEGYIKLLGGFENIEGITNCITRLRVTVKDVAAVETNDALFKAFGASGVVRKKRAIQIIIGTNVILVRAEVDKLMKRIT